MLDICSDSWYLLHFLEAFEQLNLGTSEHLNIQPLNIYNLMKIWIWTTWSHSQLLSLWTPKHQITKAPEHLNIWTSENKSLWTSENICDEELTLCRQDRFGDYPGKHGRRSGARGSTAIVVSNDFHKMVLMKQTILFFLIIFMSSRTRV